MIDTADEEEKMTKAPKKRDPNQKPIKGINRPVSINSQSDLHTEKDRLSKNQDSKWTTCTRCMGFGGMDGSCPKCGGTGFST